MKNLVKQSLAVAAIMALCTAPVLAEMRVGVVNTVKLMEEAPQARDAQSKIESEFAPREKELVALQRNIRDQEERLNRDGAVMSEAERTKLERDVLGLRRDLNRAQDEFRDDLNIRRNEALSKLQKVMYDATLALAKEQNYDLILGQGVVYASDKVDITALVLKKLNNDFRPGN
ncbi:MAG TPA: OmpH family outer membrane protein [Gammaproteobacteria bacterium]